MNHDPHDDIFDKLRKSLPEQPFPNDATRVSRGPRRLSVSDVARDVTMQTGRGLAQAGLEAVFLPSTLMRVAAKLPVPFPAVLAGTILEQTGALDRADAVKNEEARSLDMFYGRPQSTSGRAARILSQVVGEAAMIPMGGAKPRLPTVRAATDVEANAVVEAMRRAPAASKERRLLEDMFGPGKPGGEDAQSILADMVGPKEAARRVDAAMQEFFPTGVTSQGGVWRHDMGHTPPSIRDLEELLNRTAFGKPKGPFVHPERRVQPFPDESFRLNWQGAHPEDAIVSEFAPRSAREAARIKAVEDYANAGLRDAILENQRVQKGVTGKIRLKRPTSIFNFGLPPRKN